MDTKSSERPFGLRDKLGYMFGDFGNDFTFIFASSFLMVFYTNVLGIDPKMVGVLFLVARVVDAFTDIGMGRVVDRMPAGKNGKFRPWIIRICVPVALVSFLMYQSGLSGASMSVKVIYMFVTYILWGSLFYTAINIPYGSMASVITDDSRERAELSTFRSMGANFASVAIMVIAPAVIYYKDADGNQIVSARNFTLIAGVFSVLAIICYLLCYAMTAERVQAQAADKKKLSAGETVKALVTNRALLAIIAAAIFLLLSSLMVQAMNNYLFAEWFKNTRALSVVGFIGLPTTLALALATGGITERFGKKEAGVAGMLFTGVIFLLLFFFKVQNPWVFVGITFVANFGMFYFNMVIWAYITDVIDYQEVKTGSREDGTVYGVYSFARKIGQALAGGLSGFALSAIGYVSEPGAVQTDQVRQGIYNIATAFPGVCYLIVAAILWLAYPLTKNAVAENAAILAERREGGTGK